MCAAAQGPSREGAQAREFGGCERKGRRRLPGAASY